MWPFSRPGAPPGEPSLSTIGARVEWLEDAYKRLERRFIRMQGEFTAITRERAEPDYEDEDDGP